MINYSFIIPHKNNPVRLKRCLHSIPNRDDVEIIIVDDNSDSSIVDFKAFPDFEYENLIIKFNKESRGAGKARNIGLSCARGKWLVFADCDDFFTDNLNLILDKYKNSDKDIIFCAVNCISDSTLKQVKNENFDYYYENINYALSTNDYSRLRYSMNPPWGKIIRHKIVIDNNILFDEVPVANDLMFSVKTGFYAKAVSVEAQAIYNWVLNEGSLSNLKSLDKSYCHLKINISKNEFLYSHNLEEYRVNLFKIIKRFKTHGWIEICKAFVFIVCSTPFKYIIPDLYSAFRAMIKYK